MNFTNKSILETAMRQSAAEANCRAEDFIRQDNIVTLSKADPKARRYLELPFDCHFITYGSNTVATAKEEYREAAARYISRFPPEHCFETPNLYLLNQALESEKLKVCFMAEYFLPDLDFLKIQSCPYSIKILTHRDFTGLYKPEWSNALCEKRRELDVLGAGAYHGGRLIGLAGCSADCESMWQIGIDVLPEYRRQGVASALTSRLAVEILKRGKVPFYCAAWANIKSARNAIKCGFRPAWAEMTAKSLSFIDETIKASVIDC